MSGIPYRSEIDGLRAIAILSVLLYHAHLGLRAGLVGVDVFFVISGYLITSLLYQEWLTTGHIDFFCILCEASAAPVSRPDAGGDFSTGRIRVCAFALRGDQAGRAISGSIAVVRRQFLFHGAHRRLFFPNFRALSTAEHVVSGGRITVLFIVATGTTSTFKMAP